ncbi:alpha-2-macroglobulin-like protein 1 [Porphyrio hochstetteri]
MLLWGDAPQQHPHTLFFLLPPNRSLSGKPFRGRAEGKLCQPHKYGIFQNGSLGICAEFGGQTGRDGCFSTEVLMASFHPMDLDYESRLAAHARLLEEGTGLQRTTTQSCMITDDTAPIAFENTNWFYQPGTPLTGMVLLKDTKGSSLKEGKFLLVANASGEIQRKTLPMDRWGRASFELDTSGWHDMVTLHAELKDDPPALESEGNQHLNYSGVTAHLYPLSLGSQNLLQIHLVRRELPCGQPHTLWVDYLLDQRTTARELHSVDVVFLVLAKGTITTVLRKELAAEAGLRGSFSLELPISPELAPTATVLGYVVLPNSEMVADSTEIKVAKCFPNKVDLSFSEQRAPLGSQLCLKVQAAPGSLCAVYATDQRVRSSGPEGRINAGMVYRSLPLFSEDTYPSEVQEPDCTLSGFSSVMHMPPLNCYDQPRENWRSCHRSLWKRAISVSIMPPSPYNLLKTSEASGEKRLQCPPCWLQEDGVGCSHPFWQHIQVTPLLAGSGQVVGVLPDTGMQMDFVGTWLWELVPVGEGGSAEVGVTVPDAITEWEAGMFCTSPLGLGLAPATTLTAFKPFFVELALPYAVVRREAFSLVATVFSYLRQCLRVQVMLVESEELEVPGGAEEERGGCVCAGEERSFRWDLRATSLGEVNVTVIAKATQSQELCGTQMPVVPAQGHVDTETKLLMVQPPKQM